MAGQGMVIPIFPLELVLLPGEPQQLRIFEPRYRQMLDDCLLEGRPFGICLVDPFNPVMGWPGPHLIGTMARITHHEEQGANHFIEIQGQKRFIIRDIIPPLIANMEVEEDEEGEFSTQPPIQDILATLDPEEAAEGRLYIRAEVEILPDLIGELEPEGADRLLEMWSGFLDLMCRGMGLPEEILEEWAEAQLLSVADADSDSLWRIASVLMSDTWVRQSILELDDMDEALEELMSNLVEPAA